MTFWVAGAVVVGGLGSALIGSSAASNAAGAQAGAANNATQAQRDMYNQTREDNLPALGARNDALAQLEFELGIGGNPGGKTGYGALGGPITVGDVTKDPGYGFGLTQGQNALSAASTARGMRDSGASLAAAAKYGTDYATTKYDDAFNRQVTNRNQQLNPFLSLAGAGQLGASQIGQAGSNAANQIGANDIAAGDAAAQGYLAQGSIAANGVNQLAGWYQNYARSPGANGYTAGGSWASNQPDNIDAGGGWSPSDIRLKTDIVRVGTSPRGYGLYEWVWRSNGQRGRGVIAQEVADADALAVRLGEDGFFQVDYSRV